MLPDDCLGAIRANEGWFSVWPSVDERGLVVMPNSLSHAGQACADLVTIPLSQLWEFGFADLLTQTLAFSGMEPEQDDESGEVGK